MNIKDADAARSAAGSNALRLIEQYGVENGSDMIAVVALTYVRALAAVWGWSETLRLIQQQCAQHVPSGQRPKLVVSNTAEVVFR